LYFGERGRIEHPETEQKRSETMVAVNIYKAGAWHEFIETRREWLGTEPFDVIIPEQANKSQVAAAFGDSNLQGVFTIPELIERYVKTLGKKGLISMHGLESILGSVIAESAVPYLKIKKYRQGYVKALTDFIFSFRKSAMVDLPNALADFKKEDQFTLKERDLIKIYGECEAKLRDYGHDLRSGLEALLQAANATTIQERIGLNPANRILFFGFNFISRLEEEFILAIFQNAAKTIWLYCEDDDASEQAVRIQKSIVNLLERAQEYRVTEQTIAPSGPDSFFGTLANTLFHSSPDKTGALNPHSRLFITRENSRFSEVVSIARRIKDLNANGVSLNAIRIVTPSEDIYDALIREIFPDYGIPFNLENGIALLQLPLAALIHNLVIQHTQTTPYRLREKIFSSPYARFEIPIKPGDLVKYQKNAGVALISEEELRRFLQPDIRYRLDFNYIRNMRAKAYRKIKAGPETPQLEVVRKYLEGLEWANDQAKQNCLIRCLIQLYLLGRAEKELYVWQARMSGAEFKAAILELLRRFNIEANLKFAGHRLPNSAETRIQERDQAVFTQIIKFLDELEKFLAPLESTPAAKFSIGELARLFSRHLSEKRFFPEAVDGITVQSVATGQYQKWEYTFIAGLVDGEFPGTEGFNFLQPQKEGLSLGHAYTSVDHARNQFYHLILCTTETLFLSLPLSHNGRRLPPSPFIREVEKSLSPNNAAAVEPTDSATIYSSREKYIAIGKTVDNHYDAALPLLAELKNNSETLFTKITAILRFDGLALNAVAFSEFDGIFGANGSVLDLLGAAIGEITFTPTVLERYAACPLRFFLDDILHLKTEPDYHPDQTETGIFVLSALRKFTEKICETDISFEAAASFLKEFAAARWRELFQGSADAFQMRFHKQFLNGLAPEETGRPGLFAAFLTYEKEAPDLIRPSLANLGGTVAIGNELKIQVALDRVDLTRAADYYLIFSYTTQDTGNPGGILKGLRFDLPLMILLFSNYAAENGLKIPVAGAGMYSVRSPKAIKRGGYFAVSRVQAARQANVSDRQPIFSGQREGFIAAEDLTSTLKKIEDRILRLYRLMKDGVFHLPLCGEAEQSCFNCSFGRICRKDQLRLDRLRSRMTDQEKINNIEEII